MNNTETTTSIAVQAALLLFAGAGLAAVAYERWRRGGAAIVESGTRALFGSPFLRFACVALLVLLAVRNLNSELAWITAATIAATVAGADFVLLLVAIGRGNDLFIREYFQTEREKNRLRGDNVREGAEEAAKAERHRNPEGGSKASTKQFVRMFEQLPEEISVLWVDDNPLDNEMEMSALTSLGYLVQIEMSNEDAAAAYKVADFDLVISDIKRPEGEATGLELPAALQIARPERGRPKVVYYVGNRTRAITPQGYRVVTTPAELFREVARALASEPV